MSQNVDPLHDLPDEEKKKVIITKDAKIEGDVNNLLVSPKFEGPVQLGDTYVQAEAKRRETQGLYGVSELPKAFIMRTEDLAPIKSLLLTGKTASLGITGKALKIGMQGMGGIGKSTLAAALAYDVEIQKNFPHGIFWLRFGQQPNLLNIQAQLADLLETSSHTFTNVANGKMQLERMLKDRRCLLILDDVWRAEHAEPFNCLDAGAQACLLVTTRNQEILNYLDAKLHTLDIFTEAQALGLLADWTGTDPQTLPNEARELAKECGYLPLALAMTGAMAKQQGWNHALNRLRRTDFDRIKKAFPAYDHPNLLIALQASLDDLQEHGTLSKLGARNRYLDLAIFPEDTPIPTKVLETLWCAGRDGLDDLDFEDLLNGLVGCALLQRDSEGMVTLHDLQRDFIVLTTKAERPLAERQTAFLDLYRTKTAEGSLHTLPNDGYIYQHLVWHMTEAGQTEELQRLLFDFEWLRARLEKTDVNGLILDFDIVLTRDLSMGQDATYALRMVLDALHLSAHVLVHDKSQLAFQLLGRLLDFEQPEIKNLMQQIQNWKCDRLWVRPITPCLQPPGGALLRTLAGHTGWVLELAITPDGKRVISASFDKNLKVWDVESGHELHTLAGHSDLVKALAITPDGKRVISASRDMTLKVWDVETGHELHTSAGHGDPVQTLVITADGRRALSVSQDMTIKVWDVGTGKELRTLAWHSDSFKVLIITADGRRAIVASNDKILKVWDVDTGQELCSLKGDTAGVVDLTISADGKRAISASNEMTIKVWDVETGHELHTLMGHINPVEALAITPDGKRVISASRDMTLKVWDVETGRELNTLMGHTDRVVALAITPDGKRVISASFDKTLKVWDLGKGGAPSPLTGHTSSISALAITPDGKQVISASVDKNLKVWDVGTGKELHTLTGHSDRVEALALTPDGKRVISASFDKTLKVWDVETGKELRTLEGHTDWVNALAITPDGKRVISASNTLKVWDVETGQELCTLDDLDDNDDSTLWMDSIHTIVADNRRVISASNDKIIKVWDLETGQRLLTLIGHTDRVNNFTFTADRKRVISGSDDKSLKVWDVETGVVLRTLIGHTDVAWVLTVTEDSNQVISGSHDNTIRVWDVETGLELRKLHGHTAGVIAIKISADGRRAISGSMDNTLKVWSLADGDCLSTSFLEGAVSDLAASPNGKTFIAGDEGGNMYFLQLEGVE